MGDYLRLSGGRLAICVPTAIRIEPTDSFTFYSFRASAEHILSPYPSRKVLTKKGFLDIRNLISVQSSLTSHLLACSRDSQVTAGRSITNLIASLN